MLFKILALLIDSLMYSGVVPNGGNKNQAKAAITTVIMTSSMIVKYFIFIQYNAHGLAPSEARLPEPRWL